MVGAGFIAFTILNAILARGAKLTIVEVAPRILPRMVDEACAGLVDGWLRKHGVAIRAGATLTKVEEQKGKRKAPLQEGRSHRGGRGDHGHRDPDQPRMAEGLGDRDGAGRAGRHRGRRSPPLERAHRVRGGRRRPGANSSPAPLEVHAIEPTAQEHGRVAGANMAGRDLAYRGSLLMNIVEVCHLDIASFGQWDDAGAEVFTGLRPQRAQYRKLLFRGGRLTGAMICGPSDDIWTTNDVGILKGLVQTGVDLSAWKRHLAADPFDVKPAFMAPARRRRSCRKPCSADPPTHPRFPNRWPHDEPDCDREASDLEPHKSAPARARRLYRQAPPVNLSTGKTWAEPWIPRPCATSSAASGSARAFSGTRCRPGRTGIIRRTASFSPPGPLAGLPVWGTGGLTVVTRGAMTDGATSTNANGFFGFDAQVLRLRRHRGPGPGQEVGVPLHQRRRGGGARRRPPPRQGHLGDAAGPRSRSTGSTATG